jgi:hypothetical protein
MKPVRTQMPRIRRPRSWLEIAPAHSRYPDVVRDRARAYAHRVAHPRLTREPTELRGAVVCRMCGWPTTGCSTWRETCREYCGSHI